MVFGVNVIVSFSAEGAVYVVLETEPELADQEPSRDTPSTVEGGSVILCP